MSYSEILNNNKVVAVLGYSKNPSRASNRIGRYLLANGYIVYGVNPNLNGETIDGIKCFNSLADVPEEIDIVNVFRRSEHLQNIVNEILQLKNKPKVIWAQIGVLDSNAEEMALANDIQYIENKCIMIEHLNLLT